MSNHSISVRPGDKISAEVLETVKLYCIRNGKSFSYLILKLLREHKEEILNGKY